MTDRRSFGRRRERAIGDVAVDGLLAGLLAGVVMAVFLLATGLIDGVPLAQTLGRFDLAESGSPLVGATMHLAVSGIYGVGLGLLFHMLAARWAGWRRYGWLLGAIYALIAWTVARFVFLPGLDRAVAAITPLQFVLAHLVYGVVLGYILGRNENG